MINHVTDRVLAWAVGASVSPEEALAIMNVRSQPDLVLVAVLSRGFREFSPSLVVKHAQPRLLRRYPRHVLSHDLAETLSMAAALGDLPTLVHLWEHLAGPTTMARSVWFDRSHHRLFTDKAIEHGHLHILEWFVDVAAPSAQLPVTWVRHPWLQAAKLGHIGVIQWGLARKYLYGLDHHVALLSTRAEGDLTLFLQWYESARANFNVNDFLQRVSSYGLVKVLEWWWSSSTQATLPPPNQFALVVDQAIASGSVVIVRWWWDRFLALRTLAHLFGTHFAIRQLQWSNNPAMAQWLWQRSHQSGSLWDIASAPLFAIRDDWVTDDNDPTKLPWSVVPGLPVLRWWIEKCVTIGRPVALPFDTINQIVRQGCLQTLNLILKHSTTTPTIVQADWTSGFVSAAISAASFDILQWWEAHHTFLPPQDMSSLPTLNLVAIADNADILDWCVAHMTPTQLDWRSLCTLTILYNARKIQLWFRSHRDLICDPLSTTVPYTLIWPTDPFVAATPFTLDFITAISASTIGTRKLTRIQLNASFSATYWHCLHSNIKIKSLLHLTPKKKWVKILASKNVVNCEEWVQAHLAAGCSVVLPLSCTREIGEKGTWLRDVVVTRRIPVSVQTSAVVVPFDVPTS
ncbi:hypothetical protein BC828DRAFT_416437 [Blastocladiella britannica]|nr:hypothetical protein BC828DRAFT_416437 [Blastocladiella britannica]